MSNPTIAQLINPGSFVEQGLKSRFDAQITEIPCFIPRTVADLPGQFITVQFTLGQALQRIRPMPDGTFQRDAWNYTIAAVVQTVRIKDAPDTLDPVVGRAEALILAARYDSAFLNYHVLTTLAKTGNTESVRTGDDSDLSTIRFAGWISVKPSAWPTD